jgi:tetratricopeptide (TPR) repeat protein
VVFVSHCTEDDSFVNGIKQTLETLGFEVWVDSQGLTAGNALVSEVMGAIHRSDHFLAILSVNAINSRWVSKEIKYALAQKKKVIPVLLPGIEAAALDHWFDEEPVGLSISIGPDGLTAAVPALLAALGFRPAAIADLILELTYPSIDTSDGKRRAAATAALIYSPPDGSPKVASRRYRFTAPLDILEGDDLSWYLERYINWPSGIFQERARRIEAALPDWGRLLYGGLNVDVCGTVLDAWKKAPAEAERRFTVKVEKELIAGAPDDQQKEADEAAALLLSLPWELIHDDSGYLFQGTRGVRVRRSLPNRNPQRAVATKPPVRVLLVSPRPEDESAGYIDHRASARPLAEALSRLGGLAELKILDPPTFPALKAELERTEKNPYHVVHFDGHGVYDRKHGLGALCFEDPDDTEKLERRRSQLITAKEIADVIHGHRVPLFFLDACQTAKAKDDPTASVAGALLENGVASVAAMSHSVLVETARRFVTAFYTGLLSGMRVGQSMLLAQQALKRDSSRGKVLNVELQLEDWFVPVLFQEEQDPQLIRESPDELAKNRRSLVLGDVPEEPPYQFQGRSRELLQAERVLSRERYVVVEGEGGEGKTTLAAELARWLVLTRRFERAAFVRLDLDGDARKILFSIGGQLVPNYHAQAARDEKVAWQLVERALSEQPAVIVLDNLESVLEPPPDSEAGLASSGAFDADVLAGIFDLCRKLARTGRTHLIFTSREPLPDPFAQNRLRIGRLDRPDAIRLVARVLGASSGEVQSEEEIEALVDAVGCHARALVLLAGEVASSGVRRATENLHQLMAALEQKHPGERERSLLASIQLSLRRLPAATREKIKPLGVFQGGGWLVAVAMTLQLEPAAALTFARDLIGVGLVEQLPFRYLLFDPALGPALLGEMTAEERNFAHAAWAKAIAEEIVYLDRQQFKDANLASNLCRLDLSNLLAALEHLAKTEAPERVVELATRLEASVARLNRANALARAVAIQSAAAQRLDGWSLAQFQAEWAAVERLLKQGDYAGAVRAARVLLQKAEQAGEDYYPAVAQWTLGRPLQSSGAAEEALPYLEEACRRFEALGEALLANTALTDKADCLADLGRYDEAAAAYEQAIAAAEQRGDPRTAAVGKNQLATVRAHQRRYSDALRLHSEVLSIFKERGEAGSVAHAWHDIGIVHQGAGQPDAAERAYQESLKIRVQTGDALGESRTLNQLGGLYFGLGRHEDAFRCFRQCADVGIQLGDLRGEGVVRSNLAMALIDLNRYDEARAELERAIECKKPFGHVAETWKTFSILSQLEQAVGNETAYRKARHQAVESYLAYRRDGGAPKTELGELLTKDSDRVLAALQAPDLPSNWRALIPALQAILAGSRDTKLANDPNIHPADAAELLLLMER